MGPDATYHADSEMNSSKHPTLNETEYSKCTKSATFTFDITCDHCRLQMQDWKAKD